MPDKPATTCREPIAGTEPATCGLRAGHAGPHVSANAVREAAMREVAVSWERNEEAYRHLGRRPSEPATTPDQRAFDAAEIDRSVRWSGPRLH